MKRIIPFLLILTTGCFQMKEQDESYWHSERIAFYNALNRHVIDKQKSEIEILLNDAIVNPDLVDKTSKIKDLHHTTLSSLEELKRIRIDIIDQNGGYDEFGNYMNSDRNLPFPFMSSSLLIIEVKVLKVY